MVRPRKNERLLTATEREATRAAETHPRPKADRNKTPLVGWHPPADLVAWLTTEIKRRGGGRGAKSEILTDAVTLFRQHATEQLRRGLELAAVLELPSDHDWAVPVYLIACLACVQPQPRQFADQAGRGHWASAHTKETGHDSWHVWRIPTSEGATA